jgi:hypothetical protein
MLNCLVINSFNNDQFIYSVLDPITFNSVYDVNLLRDDAEDCDVLLYFGKPFECGLPKSNNNKIGTLERVKLNIKRVRYKYYIFTIMRNDIKKDIINGLAMFTNVNNKRNESLIRDYTFSKRDTTEASRRVITQFIENKFNTIMAYKYAANENLQMGSISHSIEFSPQHYQAGLGILNYFGTVIRHRYPDIPVTVRIEQEGLTVRMVIQTSEGHRETVEHTLQAYGLVVAGKMLPEEFLSDPYHVLELKNKLEVTQTELRLTHNLLQIADRQNQDQHRRLLSLETEMVTLRQLLGDALQTTRSAQQHAQELTGLLQPLLTTLTAQHDTAVQHALVTLKGIIERGITTQDEQTVKEALTTLQQKEPGILVRMVDLLGEGAIKGAAGRLLYDWLMNLQIMGRSVGL